MALTETKRETFAENPRKSLCDGTYRDEKRDFRGKSLKKSLRWHLQRRKERFSWKIPEKVPVTESPGTFAETFIHLASTISHSLNLRDNDTEYLAFVYICIERTVGIFEGVQDIEPFSQAAL